MKIQIEPRKDIMEIKPSLDKVTYVSYLSYQAAIPKAPEDVRLCDVKIAFPEEADLEYHFETKDLAGNSISVEVDNNYQPIPLIDGEIKVETVPKQTEVCFRILDENRRRIKNFYFGHLGHSIIPISRKKSKTLGDIKEAVPTFVQKLIKDGRRIKYFFERSDSNIGICKKELVYDTDEVPIVDGEKDITCWIMVSPDVCEKLTLRTCNIFLLLIFGSLFVILLVFGSSYYFDWLTRGEIFFLSIAGFIMFYFTCGSIIEDDGCEYK